jgi:hypothetical protein
MPISVSGLAGTGASKVIGIEKEAKYRTAKKRDETAL